jgi:hypothetical protein
MADGLLDWIKTPEGQGLLSMAFGGLAGAQRGAPLNSIGRAGLAGLTGYAGAQDRQQQMAEAAQAKQLRDMQMQDMRDKMARTTQIRDAAQSSMTPAMTGMGAINDSLPPELRAPVVAAKPASFDTDGFLNRVMAIDPLTGLDLKQKLVKEPKYQVVGSSLVRTDLPEPREAFRAPEKPEAQPSSVREYDYARQQGYGGTYEQWVTAQKRAAASSVNVNTDSLGLKPKDRFEMEGQLRNDYGKATTLDQSIVNVAADISNIFKQGGALKDQAAIYKFAKFLDPDGAVRESDYAAIVRTAGGLDYVASLVNKALTGEQLSPKQRKEMESLTQSMADVANRRIAKQQQTYSGRAKMYNLAPENIFSSGQAGAGSMPGQGANPSDPLNLFGGR